MGDSKTPFYFLAASSLTYIFMDIWFVAGLKMGVAGVAWATFICQGISCILAVAVVMKRLKDIRTEEPYPLFSWNTCGRIARIAVPSTIQQSFISVGNIILQSVINGFGPGVIAGYSAAIKLNNLVITSFTTLGNGVSNYAAQNIGAGKLKRIPEGFRAGLKLVWILSAILTSLYLFCGRQLLMLFMNETSGEAMKTGLMFLRIVSPFYAVVSAKLVADGILRGAGRMNEFMTATFTDLILRVTLAILLSKTALGSAGIWCSWPIGCITAAIMSVRFYRKGPWFSKENLQ